MIMKFDDAMMMMIMIRMMMMMIIMMMMMMIYQNIPILPKGTCYKRSLPTCDEDEGLKSLKKPARKKGDGEMK